MNGAISVRRLFGDSDGFNRGNGSFYRLIDGLANPCALDGDRSEPRGKAKMEVNEPIRLRIGIRNWWPPRGEFQTLRTCGAPIVEVGENTSKISPEAIRQPSAVNKLSSDGSTQLARMECDGGKSPRLRKCAKRRPPRVWPRPGNRRPRLWRGAEARKYEIVDDGKTPPDDSEQSVL